MYDVSIKKVSKQNEHQKSSKRHKGIEYVVFSRQKLAAEVLGSATLWILQKVTLLLVWSRRLP